VDSVLLGTSAARTFYTQTLLPGAAAAPPAVATGGNTEVTRRDKETVRTSHRDQKLDRFVKTAPPTAGDVTRTADHVTKTGADVSGSVAANAATPTYGSREVELASVLSLRADVESRCHTWLRQLLTEHTFVGVVSAQLSLLQHQTRLYLVNHRRLADQLFYQICLYQFGNCGLLQLEERPSVSELALLGLSQSEAGWTESDGPRKELASYIADLLVQQATMLDDYFSIQVDAEGRLLALPLLLDDFRPPIVALPLFLIRLATEVNWESERQCLHDISRELARFYSWTPPTDDASEADSFQLEHALFPAIKEQLLPDKAAAEDGTVLQVADLPDLYKVFERC